MPESTKGKMTVGEAGRRGGSRTAETHGHEFYQEIGHKGAQARRGRELKLLDAADVAIKALMKTDLPGAQEAIEFLSSEKQRIAAKV